MKKLIPFLLVFCTLVCLAGCRGSKEAPYDRSDYKQEYERLFRRNVFAQCENMGTFYATYCLARLDQKPHGEDPRYKVTFLRGPLKGKTVLTRHVITKTLPVDAGPLPKGMVVLRNFDNPRNAYDTEHLDRRIGFLYPSVSPAPIRAHICLFLRPACLKLRPKAGCPRNQ